MQLINQTWIELEGSLRTLENTMSKNLDNLLQLQESDPNNGRLNLAVKSMQVSLEQLIEAREEEYATHMGNGVTHGDLPY